MPFDVISSARMLERDLPAVWEWFNYRREKLGSLQPNPAHETIASWQERFPEFALVTQNIDGLHQAAGSRNVIEMHGNIWRARCFDCHARYDVRDLKFDQGAPACADCGGHLRPDVVLFGEMLPAGAFESAAAAAQQCELCFVVGTSAVVYPAAALPEIARAAGAYVVEVNPEPTPLSEHCNEILTGKAGEILPSCQKPDREGGLLTRKTPLLTRGFLTTRFSMKTLYFDCFAGASGDMILGALVSAGVEPDALIEQLKSLNVSGWKIDFEAVDRSGISSTYAHVQTAHEHAHRHLGDILKIIYDSGLNDRVKDRAGRIFSRLAEAESRVHNQPVEKIHFHEVGAVDAIIDVCGAAVGFDLLGIEQFISSPLRVGFGMAQMAHGRFPIPPPAVAELLKGKPIYAGDLEGEFVIPPGPRL